MGTTQLEGQLSIFDAIDARFSPYTYPHMSIFDISGWAIRESRKAWEAHHIAVKWLYELAPGGSTANLPEGHPAHAANLVSRRTAEEYTHRKELVNCFRHIGANLGEMESFYKPLMQELGIWEEHTKLRNTAEKDKNKALSH